MGLSFVPICPWGLTLLAFVCIPTALCGSAAVSKCACLFHWCSYVYRALCFRGKYVHRGE